MPDSSIRLLLVEDNPGDVRLAQETLRESRLLNHMDVVEDGEEALAYLRGEAPYQNRSLPDLILLDLHLPKVDAREVLDAIRKDPKLRDIAVVILTPSRVDEELLKIYGISASCVVLKPITVESILEALRCFGHLGLTIVRVAKAQ